LGGERVERRLTAILAADVVGYSRLMGADEEGTLERLKALRRELVDPKIAEHHGRIVKTTGDGMLVEFASVVDAVRCAVAVQQAMPERNTGVAGDNRIDLRIGINLGDVIVEGDDLYGDGVNIAARIEALADAGGVFVSHTVHDHVRDRLPFVFEDLGEQQVKNIARPVRVYRIGNGTGTAKIPAGSALALPNKPSVAVLPFTNMSAEPEQVFFADGIAEDVITALSRYPSLFVIARNSTFTYKGQAIDVKQVGRDLGVRYVLEGSLRKSGNRIRVTAQLVEAETGKHVWAEHYDRDLTDIFAVQDEITEAVTIAVAPAIADAELHRAMRKSPGNLDAWAACQRGLWHFDKATVSDYALAEKFFRQAVDLDPNLADGYCGLAMVQIYAAAGFGTGDLADALGSIGPLARQAVSLDANNAVARSCAGFALFASGDYNGALVEAERALALSPNLATGYWQRGNTLIFAGQPEKGLTDLRTSLRLDPRGSNLALRLFHFAIGCYFSRAYEDAVAAANNAVRAFPEWPQSYRFRAAALGQLGRTEEAKLALEKAIVIAPAAFDMYVRGRPPWYRSEDHAHLLEGLRKAGWEG
jgi:adenylate cyclase